MGEILADVWGLGHSFGENMDHPEFPVGWRWVALDV